MDDDDNIYIVTIGDNRYQVRQSDNEVLACFVGYIGLIDRKDFNGSLEKEARALEHARSLKQRLERG
jgi:hypothetical protein